MDKLVLATQGLDLSDEWFYRFCAINNELRIERDATGKLIIMSPVFSKSGYYNQELNIQLGTWNHLHKLGYTFDSSAGFTLENGAVRTPDGAFVLKARWKSLAKEDRHYFAKICPDFVFELRSSSDSLKELQEKMVEWIANGVKLAWLIDIENERVYIYTPDNQILTQDFALPLTGGDLLPELSINFDFIKEWEE